MGALARNGLTKVTTKRWNSEFTVDLLGSTVSQNASAILARMAVV